MSMRRKPDFARLTKSATPKGRYQRQLNRLSSQGIDPKQIKETVEGVRRNLPKAPNGSLVVYGDPQSGKTEMMICLTAALLDDGYRTIVHLTNDSVDLLAQSLDRFRRAGLAPAPRNSADLAVSPLQPGQESVLFCKKNGTDLTKLIAQLGNSRPVTVIDDEADYATPNSRVNRNDQTPINNLVGQLIGLDGKYIGVTATPARLNLNNTFDNRSETWVQFGSHSAYTGQETFFPLERKLKFRLKLLDGQIEPKHAKLAFARFLVTVAYLNLNATKQKKAEANYSFLMHTSGETADHVADRAVVEAAMKAMISGSGDEFEQFAIECYEEAQKLYPKADPDELLTYIVENASRSAFVVLNSKRDRKTAGDKPTEPTCPFTVIIGGNIVSRGVTFPNLLSMYFTRDVKTKIQQDTYIQRARMFGARGEYLEHFELTIPRQLYEDWHRCFAFHKLALESIKRDRMPPVWLGDARIAVASASSIDRATVNMDRGEMSFPLFELTEELKEQLDNLAAEGAGSAETLRRMSKKIRGSIPAFFLDYIEAALKAAPGTLAIHGSASMAGYSDADQTAVSRSKGFIGSNQLEQKRFPNAVHHVKIFHNGKGKARVFYKNRGGINFIQNLKK
jgi:hypothetical protein